MLPLLICLLLSVASHVNGLLVNGDFSDCVQGAAPSVVEYYGATCDSTYAVTNFATKLGGFSGEPNYHVDRLTIEASNVQGLGPTVYVEFWARFAPHTNNAIIATGDYMSLLDVYVHNPETQDQRYLRVSEVEDVEPTANGFRRYRAVADLEDPFTPSRISLVSIEEQQLSTDPAEWVDIWIDDVNMWVAPDMPPSVESSTPAAGGMAHPQFIGLHGQTFQVNGVSNAVYNLVTSPNSQVNARFVSINAAHPGLFLGEIGVQQRVNNTLHKLLITSGDAGTGFATVILDNEPGSIGSQYVDSSLFEVRYDSAYKLYVTTQDFTFTFEITDLLINFAAEPTKDVAQLTCHGLFGQTHSQTTYSTANLYIQGEVADYRITENTVFGKQFAFNQFV